MMTIFYFWVNYPIAEISIRVNEEKSAKQSNVNNPFAFHLFSLQSRRETHEILLLVLSQRPRPFMGFVYLG